MDPIAGFVLGFCIDHSYLDMVVDDLARKTPVLKFKYLFMNFQIFRQLFFQASLGKLITFPV
jgi:hypothetical protein